MPNIPQNKAVDQPPETNLAEVSLPLYLQCQRSRKVITPLSRRKVMPKHQDKF